MSHASPARYLYQKVQILAVGQTRKLEPGETAATNADGTPAAAATSGLHHLRGARRGRPADRLGRRRRASTSPSCRRTTSPRPLGPLDTGAAAARRGSPASSPPTALTGGRSRRFDTPDQHVPSTPVLRQGPAPIATNPTEPRAGGRPRRRPGRARPARRRSSAAAPSRSTSVDALQASLTGGPARARARARPAPAPRRSPRSASTLQAHREVGTILVTDELSTDLLQTALALGRQRRAGRRRSTPTSCRRPWPGSPRRLDVVVAAPARRRRPRPSSRRPTRASSGKVITVFSTKGGAGKSVLAANLAVVLARRSRQARRAGRRRPAVRRRRRDAQAGPAAHDRRRRRLARPPRPHAAHAVPDAPRAVGPADPAGPARAVVRRPDQRRRDGADRRDAAHASAATSSSTPRPTSTRSCSASSRRATTCSSIAGMDIPNIKNVKIGLQTLRLLNMPDEQAPPRPQPGQLQGEARRQRGRAHPADQGRVAHPERRRRAAVGQQGRPRWCSTPRSPAWPSRIEQLADMFVADDGSRRRR